MRHEDQGGAVIAMERLEQLHHVLARSRIQVAGRFVCQQNRWVTGKGSGHRHPLLFASRELDGIMMEPFSQAHGIQQFRRAILRRAHPGQLQRHQDIFQCREGGNEVKGLKDVADVIATEPRQGTFTHRRDFDAVQRDGTGRWPIQPRDEAQQGGLPAPGRADDGHALLIGNLKCEIVEDGDLMAASGQAHCEVRNGDHRVGQVPTVSSTSRLYYTG